MYVWIAVHTNTNTVENRHVSWFWWVVSVCIGNLGECLWVYWCAKHKQACVDTKINMEPLRALVVHRPSESSSNHHLDQPPTWIMIQEMTTDQHTCLNAYCIKLRHLFRLEWTLRGVAWSARWTPWLDWILMSTLIWVC